MSLSPNHAANTCRRKLPLRKSKPFPFAPTVFACSIGLLVLGDMPSAMRGSVSSTPAERPIVAQTTRISVSSDGTEANGPSYYPSVSADGRWVAFTSRAPSLSANGDPPYPILLRDNQSGQVMRIGVGTLQGIWKQ